MNIMVRLSHPVGTACMLAALIAGTVSPVRGANDSAAVDVGALDTSNVRILSLGVRLTASYPLADLELVNSGTLSFIYAGDTDSKSPAPRRQCSVNGTWTAQEESNCGTGLSTLRLEPGQHVKFSAALCPGTAGTKIGVLLGDVDNKSNGVVWSSAIDEKVVP